MAANHRIIEIGKTVDGSFHYHVRKGRNVLVSASGYNAKATIVRVAGHLFGLSEDQKKFLGHHNKLNMDDPIIPVLEGKKRETVICPVPETS